MGVSIVPPIGGYLFAGMNKKGFTCANCGSLKFNKVFDVPDYVTGDLFEVRKCLTCQLVSTYPMLDGTALGRYYRGYRKNNGKRFWTPIETLLNVWHIRRAIMISRVKRNGTILDIGCGRGLELEKLYTLGWNTYGTERFGISKNYYKQKGINLFLGDIWEAQYPVDFFDVVTLWHSLEHMTSPVKVLTEIRRILKDNGMVKIAVPNFDSWERILTNEDWFHLDIPRHVYHFSTATMRAILEKNGFTITNIMYAAPEYDFYSFCQSLLNTLPFWEKYLLYKKLQGEVKSRPLLLLNILCQVPFLIVFAALSVFFVPLSWMFKKSGTIEITAMKNQQGMY